MKYGITGIARSGKNEVASMLQKHFPEFPIVALADPIKEVFCKTLGWDARHKDGEFKERVYEYLYLDEEILATHTAYYYGVSRKLAEKAVSKLQRHLGSIEGVTVESFDRELIIQNASPRMLFQVWGSEVWRDLGTENFWVDMLPDDCIVSDVRFDNEAKNVDHVIKVIRPNIDKVARDHVSEAGVSDDLIQYLIVNDGSLDDLRASTQMVADSLRS